MTYYEVRLPFAPARDRIEVVVSFPEGAARSGAVLFPPFPLLGGDLDNNVLRACTSALVAAGHAVLRFNYSTGGAGSRFEYWQAVEERGDFTRVFEDGAAALARARKLFEPTLLAGYSFGAFVAQRVAPAGIPLVLIAPPVGRLRFEDRKALMIHAGADELDPPPVAGELSRRFPSARHQVLDGAEHFFRGREAELAAFLVEECR